MKKICFVTTISGTLDSFVLNTAKYIHENTDWDITFICNYDKQFEEKLPDYIHYIPVKMQRGINLDGIKAIAELKRIFKKEKFDLIQYSTPNAALYASIAARIVGCKIRNYHLMGFRYLGTHGIGRFILKTIERVSCWNSTSIECVSKSNLDLGIKEKVFPAKKATVIWNGSTGGVDLQRFDYSKRDVWRRELREELGYEASDFIYGFVGRITRDKGINELLEAFFELENGSKLFLIGNVEDEDTLDEHLWMKAKSHPDVQIHIAASDIERYFAMIDVLVLPSYREGFGNVVIEAGAVGTPAIVSNIPGPTDAMIKDKTGLVVEKADVKSLAEAMNTIYNDRELYQSLAFKAHNFAKEHFEQNKLFEYIVDDRKKLLGEN